MQLNEGSGYCRWSSLSCLFFPIVMGSPLKKIRVSAGDVGAQFWKAATVAK